MDWLASDLPIATHSNGAIFVMTMDLKSSSSAMAQMDLDGMFLCLDLSVPLGGTCLQIIFGGIASKNTCKIKFCIESGLRRRNH